MTWRRLALLAVSLLIILGMVIWSMQRRLIYFPAGPPPPVERVLPGASEVSIPTADGLALESWFLRAGSTGVVVFPGNAGNRAFRAPLAQALSEAGLSVLLLDYRGYGGNPGRPSERGLLTDGRAAADWLRQRSDIDRIVYYGESIGAAVAAGVARGGPEPAALILRSPFSSLGDVARVHFGPVPDWILRDRFPAARHIGAVKAPTLVVVAGHDEIVPVTQSRRIYDAAPGPKRFVTVRDARHNDREMLDGRQLVDAVLAFLHSHGVPAES